MRILILAFLAFGSCNSVSVDNDASTTNSNTTSSTNNTSIEASIGSYALINQYPHNTQSFTEGLEFYKNSLYESTGDSDYSGKSKLAKIDVATGKDLQVTNLAKEYFGEGCTFLNGEAFMMTYKERKCFVFDAITLKPKNELSYDGEGWGMTNNGKQLINSNGTNNIYFRNPKTFAVESILQVYNQNGPVSNINELEYVNGFIYANVWTTNNILKIDGKTGKVLTTYDLTDLYNQYINGKYQVNEFNGIAYNPANKHFYVTGKNWPLLFELELK